MAAGLADFYPALPILFVISLVLLVLPVWGFIRGKNTPVLFYVAWLFLGNAIYFVNMLVWRGSVVHLAPVYCDIGESTPY
jgi:pheromone a factor receptor